MAFLRAKKARGKGRSPLERSKSLSLSRVDAFCETIRTVLKRVYTSFPSFDQLSAFYWELIDIVAVIGDTKAALGKVHWTYEKVGDVAREARSAVGRSQTVQDVERARKACYGRVSSLLGELEAQLRFLGEVRDDLKRLPGVDPNRPTVVVAGAPNVGKSQLVRAMSSGRPRVASYPFTTQDLFLGHFEVEGTQWQIMDTPGLLDRPVSDRNDMERKALVALRHLATLIIFLIDPTETCGYPMKDQEALLTELKELYPETLILEVENKADLGPSTGKRRRISALTGEGVEDLIEEVIRETTSPAPEDEPPQEAE